jgi:predicted nucleic-acid-binding protein
VWTLSSYYSRKKSEVIEVVEAVTDILGGRIEDDHRIEVASEIYKEYSVKFIDALIASSPSILSGETIVVSYDKDFDKIGIKRLEPSDFIKSKRLNN